MKRCVISFFLCGVVSVAVVAEEYLLHHGSCLVYDEDRSELVDKEFHIKYDDTHNVFYLRLRDKVYNAWIELTYRHLNRLEASLEKYLEWEDIAIAHKVEIDKTIPESKIQTGIIWEHVEDGWFAGFNFTIEAFALSQDENRHHMILRSTEVTSRESSLSSYKMEMLVFERAHVEALLEGIGSDAIKALNKVIKEKKAKGPLFQ